MQVDAFVKTVTFALAEGSVYERLRRHPEIRFDPHLAHATLIYDGQAASILERLHREYLDVAQRYGLAMFAATDTWRANHERLCQSDFRGFAVNQDNARFMTALRDSYGPTAHPIYIAGQIGPRGDAYRPAEALSSAQAERFHAPQIEALAQSRVDFLQAATLPAFSEAQGIAAAMAKTGLPYVLSFVVQGDGTLLDGTPFDLMIQILDDSTPAPPMGYAVNCVHPAIFQAGLSALAKRDSSLPGRVLCYQANASPRSPEELDGLCDLDSEKPETLADLMLTAHQRFHTPVLGGCCGTDSSHLECLARKYKALSQ
jgi:homocysteine S-methyltransferase